MTTTTIFGRTFSTPLKATSGGRLEISEGEDCIWNSVEEILSTAPGTRPMDPGFGFDSDAYEVVQDVQKWAYDMAASIERCDPRVDVATIYIERFDHSQGTVYVRIGLQLINEDTEINRVFPFYTSKGNT